jgi:3-hydroxyisobutyrate dehydrogenase-like beta-hydroxyacid dehydrogenase
MVNIGFIGLGHMGFPMARRQRSRKRNTREMVKDVRLYLDEAKALGVPAEVAEAVARLGNTLNDEGADPDFTSAIKPIERAAGVTVGGSEKRE